ncbi:MAG: efflux RND transporter periplasmic adaptor subunit [Anaerovibrio sp.]|uniref:efflux RND transporter periplasmic adaptor subunit n=1 Tax=Anaerovibrio sp. TaxID=1872532 RepID=UPI0025F786EB|nr:efflux RND transporter periplasmic adaptor subunit [Anaerovibrio sp.]MCR5177051.1 efflux RND transporter periplasmic adaptor subunit [Anaerovibrio sp.]
MRHDWSGMINNKRFRTAGAVCLVLVIVLGIFVFGKGQDGKKNKGPALPKVELYQVKRGDMMRHILLSGQTVSDATVVLAPKYAGRVVDVRVKLGDTVSEGDVLLVQDTGDLDIAIMQGEAATEAAYADAETEEVSYDANLAKTAAAYEIQKSHYERQQYLFSIGAISQDTLDNARDGYITSKAAYDMLLNQNNGDSPASVRSKQFAARKNAYSVDALKKQRDDMIIRAPRGGIIGYRNVEVGNYLTAGSKVLTLIDNSHLYVDCSLSENDAALLSAGMPVAVTIDALGEQYSGKIVYVSPGMADGSKAYSVRISLDIAKGNIKAGLFSRTAIDILQRKDTLFAPKDAVLTKNGRTTVFVYNDAQETVEEREVTLGLLNDSEVEILTGINDGESVVVSNLDRLKNGCKVVLGSGDKSGDGI